jgi:hypothetical protein
MEADEEEAKLQTNREFLVSLLVDISFL